MRDYHMHTHFCRHAVGHASDYAQAAQSKGIREICFTPHIPLPGFRPGFWSDRLRMDEDEFDMYLEELEDARARFPGVTILSGVEADYVPSMETYLERFLSQRSFDFVLMSIHHVSAWDENEWVFGFDPQRSIPAAYGDYFREMRAGIETGLFDCVAHFDLIKQPGNPVLETNRDDVEDALDRCLDRGMSIEINTSGTRKAIGEMYPADAIVQLMIDRNIPLVTGSDSHAPVHVGTGFDRLSRRFGDALECALVGYRQREIVRESTWPVRVRAGRC